MKDKDYTNLDVFKAEQVFELPFWYDQKVHSEVCHRLIASGTVRGKLDACKYLLDTSKQYKTNNVYGLQWAKYEIVDKLDYFLMKKEDTPDPITMHMVLTKLINAFPEMENIYAMDSRDQWNLIKDLSEMWPQIKEAAKYKIDSLTD